MRVLFFSPHPDDIELFCGGTFLRHIAADEEIAAVMMTKGGAGSLSPWMRGERLEAIRVRECEQRFASFPRVAITWLGLRDGRVQADAVTVEQVRQLVAQFRPELIYLPESACARSYYRHRDHIRTGQIVETALRDLKMSPTLRYYHSRQVNRLINIDDYYSESQRALRFYASQYSATAIPPFCLYLLEAVRALMVKRRGRQAGSRYAEGFREQEWLFSDAPEP